MSIKKFLSTIATCGPLGGMRGGGLIASLAAIPLVFGCRLFSWMNPNIHFFLHGLLLFLAFLAIYITVHATTELDSSEIVLDKVIGLSIAYCCISLNVKLYGAGFLFFHVANILIPWFITKTWNEHLEHLPHAFGIVASDVLAGAVVHFLLRIIVWLGR